MIYRNCGWVVVANRRQFNDSHDIILQEVIIVKKWTKENHSYHELPHEGDENTRISAEPVVSPESKAVNRLNQISLSKCSRLSTSTFNMATPKERPHHNSNKKNGFMKSI